MVSFLNSVFASNLWHISKLKIEEMSSEYQRTVFFNNQDFI